MLDCFDTRLTFDSADADGDLGFDYLPLFYTPDYAPLPSAEAPAPRRYDLSFIGTLHTERYTFAKTMFAQAGRAFGFFFVQARWYFAIVKYLTREHARVPWSDVRFTSLNRQEVAEVFRNSHAVLDMQRDGQSGLTMRTFEVLASGSVLVTTNEAIAREPFYDPDRVVVVPAEVAALDAADVSERLARLPTPAGAPAGFERYSLRSWTRTVAGRS